MKRITGINFLRFIAALGIIVFHFGYHNPIADFLRSVSPNTNFAQGDLWVTLFLMISGMCLARIEQFLNNKIVIIVSWAVVLCVLFIPMPWMAKLLYPAIIYRVVFFFVALKSLGAWIEHFSVSGKIITWLAALSYPMFLLQHVVIVNVLNIIGEPQTLWMAALLLLLDIVLTIVLAWGATLLLSAIQTQIQKRIDCYKKIK